MKIPLGFRLIITGTFILLLIIIMIKCSRPGRDSNYSGKDMNEQVSVTSAEFAGRESCRECHEKQYNLFLGSDHDMSMNIATDSTVLGDFNNVTFTQGGITSRFFRNDDKYLVNTEGADGEMKDYEIHYVFGIRPLQQYIVKFPEGRYQMLPICWDTRPEELGGQRWFHIYGQEHIPPEDILFWTRITQNWNYMCSECHSTHVRKQFDYASCIYNTTWKEIDVSCEACHGPCSIHIEWARNVEEGGRPDAIPDMGLVLRLKDSDNATWVFDMEQGTAKRSVPRTSGTLVQMCGRCHARRSIATEDYTWGGHLLETHWPSLLEEGLYYPDGQILEEVYVYASFLQSKMYTAGVTCKDCHEPHSGKVFVHGNALCYRCHLAEKYGSRSHHFHDPAQNGSSCFECHMPERTYMVIDPRRDHSIRVPRPDLSHKLKTPNACIQCHTEQTNQWAGDYLKQWYGNVEKGKKHYGETFWAAQHGYPEALPELVHLATDTSLAPMIRATAVYLFQNYNDPSVLRTLHQTINDQEPLIRFASLNTFNIADENTLAEFVIPRLTDSIMLIRALSARLLTNLPSQYFNRATQRLRQNALDEYFNTQMINADHPSAHMNLGIMYLNLGDYQKAEASYIKAIEIEPAMTTAYINLADLYRMLNRDAEGEELLRNALKRDSLMSAVHYSLGLLLVRKGNQQEAMEHLKQAALLEPENARFTYVYGVGLYSGGNKDAALKYLESALKKNPYDRDILYSLTTFNQEQGNIKIAKEYASKLVEYYPQDQNYRQLLQYLLTL